MNPRIRMHRYIHMDIIDISMDMDIHGHTWRQESRLTIRDLALIRQYMARGC